MAKRGLLIFPNPDKKARARSGPDHYMPLSPFRLLLSGPPNSGKRNALLNVVLNMDPKPSAFHVVHYDPNTVEYDTLGEFGAPVYYYSPDDPPTDLNLTAPDPPDDYPQDAQETLGKYPFVVIDEVTSSSLSKEAASRIERLLNFTSTHRNANIAFSIQDLTLVDKEHRHAFNQFCLWPFNDKKQKMTAAAWVGTDLARLEALFKMCRPEDKDFIWIDTDVSHDSPWRYRLCLMEPVMKKRAN